MFRPGSDDKQPARWNGMRHKETRTLRIKDLHVDTGHIVVRNGNGQKDRVTVLPKSVAETLRAVVEEAKKLHKRDLQDGYGRVYLPFALSRKYPNADRETTGQDDSRCIANLK